MKMRPMALMTKTSMPAGVLISEAPRPGVPSGQLDRPHELDSAR